MLRPLGNTPGLDGMIGTQGPALGMRRPAHVQVDGDGAGLRTNRDGSLQFQSGARLSSRITTTQTTLDPVTPLKTRAEQMRGGHVDFVA